MLQCKWRPLNIFSVSAGEQMLNNVDNLSAAMQTSTFSEHEGQCVASLTIKSLHWPSLHRGLFHLYICLESCAKQVQSGYILLMLVSRAFHIMKRRLHILKLAIHQHTFQLLDIATKTSLTNYATTANKAQFDQDS